MQTCLPKPPLEQRGLEASVLRFLLDLRKSENVRSCRARTDNFLNAGRRVFLGHGDLREDADRLLAFLDAVAPLVPCLEGQDIDVGLTLVGPGRKARLDGVEDDLRILGADAVLVGDTEGDRNRMSVELRRSWCGGNRDRCQGR